MVYIKGKDKVQGILFPEILDDYIGIQSVTLEEVLKYNLPYADGGGALLAILREPEEDCRGIDHPEGFKFYGYDLIEDDTRISALTNCGGFDKAFSASDLSRYGLIEEFRKARDVQLRLLENYPDEAHADCTLWAIWKMVLID